MSTTSGTGAIPAVRVRGCGMSSAVREKALPLLPAGGRFPALNPRD